MRKSLLLFLIFLWSTFAMAQSSAYYVVVVGNFMNAKPQDFEAIRPIGFVHSNQLNDNLYQIYLGGFNQKAEAQKAVTQLKQKGYTNAYVQERFPSEGRTVTVIQIATRSTQKPVNWEEFMNVEDLYVILKEDMVKIVTGFYPSVDAAKQALGPIRNKGYRDAFIKNVNSIYLHKLTEFETGIKKPLIPLSFDNQPQTRKQQQTPSSYSNQRAPTSYDNVVARSPAATTATPGPSVVETSYLPEIRSNIKRKSVLELQKVLKAEGMYNSGLDGLYGRGTMSAYDNFKNNNRELQKYYMLGQVMNFDGQSGPGDQLQQAINNLLDDPAAPSTIERFNTPIAKGYQAYLLFTSLGPGSEVNTLMNNAIDQAYSGKKMQNQPPFDYRATYAYEDLGQLILHLHYLHSAPGSEYAAPCWLFQRHPKETARAYETYARFSSENFRLQACDQFLSWDEVRTMQAMAVDLNPDEKFNSAKLAASASARARLFIAPQAPDRNEQKALETWDQRLWNGLNNWAARDPLHQKRILAFKVAYHQTQIRLEDYFMDQGFNSDDAKGLALATLQTLVGYHLERYV